MKTIDQIATKHNTEERAESTGAEAPLEQAVPGAASETQPGNQSGPGTPCLEIRLGLDVHLAFIMVAEQVGHQPSKSPRKLDVVGLVAEVKRWIAQGHQVWCVQEACGFGFTLHRQLEAAGAHSLVITPQPLGDRRKTDRLDASQLLRYLSRYVDGQRDELRPIRIPKAEEEQLREVGRRREFFLRQVRRLANRGLALRIQREHQGLPSQWWGPRNWKRLEGQLEPSLKAILQGMREPLLSFQQQATALTEELVGRVKGQSIPRGLGALTLALLDGEICDWGRFHNRKQAGSYTGCCPGVHGSGGHWKMGNIDRHGNGRVRRQLVEAVWRLLKHQSRWHALHRHLPRLGDPLGGRTGSKAQRKKVVVALARQLAIDLWRWRTGRCNLEQLGLVTITV